MKIEKKYKKSTFSDNFFFWKIRQKLQLRFHLKCRKARRIRLIAIWEPCLILCTIKHYYWHKHASKYSISLISVQYLQKFNLILMKILQALVGQPACWSLLKIIVCSFSTKFQSERITKDDPPLFFVKISQKGGIFNDTFWSITVLEMYFGKKSLHFVLQKSLQLSIYQQHPNFNVRDSNCQTTSLDLYFP